MKSNPQIRRLRNPLTAVLVFAASLGISIAYDSRDGNKQARQGTSEAQRKLDALARSHASKDELRNLLRDSKTVQLDSSAPLTDVSRFRSDARADMFVLDVFGRRVLRFNAAGKFLGPLGTGKTGSGPGEFLFPSGIEVQGTDAMVSDFKQSRVSKLSDDGTFRDSFSIGAERFSAKSVFSSGDGSYSYVCGNRYSAGLTAVHVYSAAGEFEGSLLQLPSWAQQLKLDVFDDCLPAKSPGRTVVAFPYEYRVFELDGSATKQFDLEPPADFRKPARALNLTGLDPSRQIEVFETWKTEWTPLEAIGLADDDTLLVEYRTNNPLRYTLDLWSLQDLRRLRTIHTNYRLVDAEDGRSYFLADKMKEGQPYEILSGVFSR